MKVIAVILVATALADGKGSGPYLPSGWRPDGPAFFLPSEIVKPSPTPDLGSEASGSDFLREYGPPKIQDISQNLLSQGLPDVTIEQDFSVLARNAGSSQVVAEKVEITSEVQEAVTTELPTTLSISAELPILNFEVNEPTSTTDPNQATESIQSNLQASEENSQASLQRISEQINRENLEHQTIGTLVQNQKSSEESVTAQTSQQESVKAQTSQQKSVKAQTNQQESTSTVSALEVTASADSVGNTEKKINAVPSIYEQNIPELQNIPDILANLEKDILTEQVEQAVGKVAPVHVPEGFLEYGPPGFTEYGPPKEEQGISVTLQATASNETRRRRFSPRLRLSRQ